MLTFTAKETLQIRVFFEIALVLVLVIIYGFNYSKRKATLFSVSE